MKNESEVQKVSANVAKIERNSEKIIEKNIKNEANTLNEVEEALEAEKLKVFLLKKELLEQLDREEKVLLELQKLKKHYDALRKSKLGRITVKYWTWKKRRR